MSAIKTTLVTESELSRVKRKELDVGIESSMLKELQLDPSASWKLLKP